MEQQDAHFNKLYWFCVGLTVTAVVFDICMVWVPIPKDNQKYADVLLGSLNTGALMAGITFLLGGNAIQKKQQPTVQNAETVNVQTPTTQTPQEPAQG
jgi:uncharacterized membrane protein